MEEKERYEWYNHSTEEIYDNKENIVFVGAITVLNQQNRRIWELIEENKQLKQQLEDTEESYNRTMVYLNIIRSELLNLPKKIVAEIRKEIEFPLYFHPDFDEFECVFDIDKLLGTILKKYEVNKNE